jgi:hypothetical protein
MALHEFNEEHQLGTTVMPLESIQTGLSRVLGAWVR